MLTALSLAVAVTLCAQENPPPQKQGAAPLKKKSERKKEDSVRFEGSLSSKDPVDKLRPGCFHKVHEHKMTPGKVYVIEMIDQNGGSSMDPYLRLENSAGVMLAQDDDSAGNLNARIIFAPTKEDTYKIIATTCNSGRSGKYYVTIQSAPPGAIVAGGGPVVTVQVPVDVGDLTITPLPVWGLNSNNLGSTGDTHGYIEYRFLIENNSETDSHTVKLSLPRTQANFGFRMGHYLLAARKVTQVGPGGSVEISIFQPDLPLPGVNDAEVEIDGRPHERGVPVSLIGNRGNRANPYYFGGGGSRGLIATVLAPDGVLQMELRNNAFKSAVGVDFSPPGAGGYSSTTGIYQEPGPYFNKAYTYFETMLFQTAPLMSQSWSKHWLGYTSFDGIALTGDALQAAPAEVRTAVWQFVECGGTLLVVGPAQLPESWQRVKEELPGFVRYYPGFGQCLVATKVNPKNQKIEVAAWDPDDWRLITKMWHAPRGAWQQMSSPTDANRAFPIVDGLAIPVRGLFIVMLLFVVLIGPVNIYWLSRARRRIWLLWTVPLFSLFTCVLLVGYMLVTEGWHGHVRSDSVTVLDEASQRAATIGWQGYYCPTTPAGGLRFSLETELTPHLNHGSGPMYGGRHSYAIDWTNEQHLSDGWVVAKVPIHFMVRKNEKRLERVNVRKNNDGSLLVVNGLGADIKAIHLAGADGKIFTANDIRAGAEANLKPAEQQAVNKLTKLKEAFEGVGGWPASVDAMAEHPAQYLRPGCYLAVLDDSPFLEQGLRHTQSRRLHSVVFGIMKEVP